MNVRRTIEPRITRALAQFRVVAIAGARQVGKSTLAQGIAGRHYVTLDDVGVLEAASADPRGFVARLPVPATIDEIQRVPALLLAIKEAVDRDRRPGAYLITGSSRIDAMRGIRESLAGRIALFTLRPMNHLELCGVPEADPISRLFDCRSVKEIVARYASVRSHRFLSSKDFLSGGFPEAVLHLDEERRRTWFDEYRKTAIERDVPAILRVDDVPTFHRFVVACAATTARLLNLSELARDLGVSVDTARRWVSVLEATFIVERREPYWRNVRKRLVKTPKVFLADSGLASSLIGLRSWEEAIDDSQAGPILETWVHANLAALAEASSVPTTLHFLRTHAQAEVDFVLARDRRLGGIEVKPSATVRLRDAKGIEELAAHFPKAGVLGIVLYLGDAVIPLSDHAAAVPLARFFAP
jgi:predicted AAA+ superfamily ATPase